MKMDSKPESDRILGFQEKTGKGRLRIAVGIGIMALLALLSLIPASFVAVDIVNRTITAQLPPRPLPKLELETIPSEARTCVAVPVLISSARGIDHLLEGLRIRYLANQDRNLHFALLGDFADAPAGEMPEDARLLEYAVQGIRSLNGQYGAGQADRFYYFHRRRLLESTPGRMDGLGTQARQTDRIQSPADGG